MKQGATAESHSVVCKLKCLGHFSLYENCDSGKLIHIIVYLGMVGESSRIRIR